MDVDSRNMAVLETQSGAPLLFGLMMSTVLSVGLWLTAWWLSSLIRY